MPIVFDEVTAEIEAPRRGEESQQASTRQQSVRLEDFDARMERALQLREERLARLSDE